MNFGRKIWAAKGENDGATLVLAADEALYDSKRHGRNRITMSTLLNFRFAAVN
ncbi:hypothetical protein IQ270_00800 [Microcoleus sp. LEGE 07076]|nr:hypothetical protein [Microcoleus sp. LEGE 07076]